MSHTINRKKRASKKDILSDKILKILNEKNQPISTQEIALSIEKPWHSIQTRCLKLQIDGKVNGFRVGRMNLWTSGGSL